MANIKKYLLDNFARNFLLILLPFFLIISLVYFVRISMLTSQISISFGELLELYWYFIPSILFYTIPVSFITAVAMVLTRLSFDNELIALYALGVKSSHILRTLLILSILFSLLLFALSFFAMPLAKNSYRGFIDFKKSEAKVHITAGMLGQQFGDYFVYVQDKNGTILQEIVIYNRSTKNQDQIFAAKNGEIEYLDNIPALLLRDGYGYTYDKPKLQQIKYETLRAFDTTQHNIRQPQTILEYWQETLQNPKTLQRAYFFLFISLIPICSLYLIAAWTMINPRYQSNKSFIVIFVVALIFYAIASVLEERGGIVSLVIVSIVLCAIGHMMFRQKVARYF